jgi:ribosome-binding factor A
VTRRSARGGTARDYPRTARLNHLVHEIVAEEIERIDDDRLGLLTVVGVEFEPDIRHATVWYTTLGGDTAPPAEGDEVDPLTEALEEHRKRVQAAIGRQSRMKRTPELIFRPDPVTAHAERVESILREVTPEEAAEAAAREAGEGNGANGGNGAGPNGAG